MRVICFPLLWRLRIPSISQVYIINHEASDPARLSTHPYHLNHPVCNRHQTSTATPNTCLLLFVVLLATIQLTLCVCITGLGSFIMAPESSACFALLFTFTLYLCIFIVSYLFGLVLLFLHQQFVNTR